MHLMAMATPSDVMASGLGFDFQSALGAFRAAGVTVTEENTPNGQSWEDIVVPLGFSTPLTEGLQGLAWKPMMHAVHRSGTACGCSSSREAFYSGLKARSPCKGCNARLEVYIPNAPAKRNPGHLTTQAFIKMQRAFRHHIGQGAPTVEAVDFSSIDFDASGDLSVPRCGHEHFSLMLILYECGTCNVMHVNGRDNEWGRPFSGNAVKAYMAFLLMGLNVGLTAVQDEACYLGALLRLIAGVSDEGRAWYEKSGFRFLTGGSHLNAHTSYGNFFEESEYAIACEVARKTPLAMILGGRVGPIPEGVLRVNWDALEGDDPRTATLGGVVRSVDQKSRKEGVSGLLVLQEWLDGLPKLNKQDAMSTMLAVRWDRQSVRPKKLFLAAVQTILDVRWAYRTFNGTPLEQPRTNRLAQAPEPAALCEGVWRDAVANDRSADAPEDLVFADATEQEPADEAPAEQMSHGTACTDEEEPADEAPAEQMSHGTACTDEEEPGDFSEAEEGIEVAEPAVRLADAVVTVLKSPRVTKEQEEAEAEAAADEPPACDDELKPQEQPATEDGAAGPEQPTLARSGSKLLAGLQRSCRALKRSCKGLLKGLTGCFTGDSHGPRE